MNSLKIVNVFAILIPIFTLFTGLVTLLIAWVGGTQIIELKLSLGQLTAFTTYVTIFTTPIFILGFLATSIGQTLTSAKRISEILTSKNTFINGKEKVNKFESLSFKNISFSLNKEDVNVIKLLNNISFEVNKGEKLGIIGSSGSGKSLILKLIMRFYEPIEGSIILNSKDIKEFEVDSYRNLVSFVPQENFIFNGTIKENITFGTDHRIDQDNFERICKICAIDDFATKFPHGYDEETGERGTTLSGGQKQRITLARALLRKPQILVLDDSTSRLDIKTERKILEAIQNEFPEITIIIVAQKVASISWCDQILVIEDGCIDSKGTHEELKKSSFIYKEIELSQSNYNLETINA
jgi:ATP-binding cassette subfamily B protein